MLNFYGQRCTLCREAIETPKHLFTACKYGRSMRDVRNNIIDELNNGSLRLTNDNLINGKFKNKNKITNIMKYVIILSNYNIYKNKMKKHYCYDSIIDINQAKYDFKSSLKKRIICDHHRMNQTTFLETWDPGGNNIIFYLNGENKLYWNF